jgi:hypothetical protein
MVSIYLDRLVGGYKIYAAPAVASFAFPLSRRCKVNFANATF